MTLDKPNFVIIGAPKSGTTALYHYLQQHPQVFMSAVKEPRFFSYLAVKEHGEPENPSYYPVQTLDAYRALFAGAEAKAVGEASVSYLEIPGTAAYVQQLLPRAKLIALLRNPADRAYSHYLMNVRAGKETVSFREAIDQNRYVRGGFYYKHLSDYYRYYSAEAIGVYLYDDLTASPVALLQSIFRFLDVDETFVPDVTERHNVGGAPRNRWAARVFALPRLNAWIKRAAPSSMVRLGQRLRQRSYRRVAMPSSVRAQLVGLYAADIEALARLLGRDLSHWLDDDAT